MNKNPPVSSPQELLKPGEKRVVAVEHIIERRHRHRVGAVRAEKAAERVKLCRRSVHRNHSRGGRPAEPRYHAEAITGLRKPSGDASLHAGTGLPELAGARPGRD